MLPIVCQEEYKAPARITAVIYERYIHTRRRLVMKRYRVSLVVFIIFSTLILSSCGGADQSVSASSTQPTSAQATQVPTKAPAPNLARLGGSVHDFDLKFGKEDTSNGGIGYQQFGSYTSGQDLPTDKFDIAVDNRHVEGVTVTLPKESPLNWQDGTKLCQSFFLPTDAVYRSDNDSAPLLQVYQQLYISKKIASMFSADHFMSGSGAGRTQDTPGTIQITYYYTSFSDHTNNAQITSCDIELGEPN
jgi:hypothetical protein